MRNRVSRSRQTFVSRTDGGESLRMVFRRNRRTSSRYADGWPRRLHRQVRREGHRNRPCAASLPFLQQHRLSATRRGTRLPALPFGSRLNELNRQNRRLRRPIRPRTYCPRNSDMKAIPKGLAAATAASRSLILDNNSSVPARSRGRAFANRCASSSSGATCQAWTRRQIAGHVCHRLPIGEKRIGREPSGRRLQETPRRLEPN